MQTDDRGSKVVRCSFCFEDAGKEPSTFIQGIEKIRSTAHVFATDCYEKANRPRWRRAKSVSDPALTSTYTG